MGWDTQITVLAENCKGNHKEIARLIYQQDAKDYMQSGYHKICFKKSGEDSVLFFTYERRKYLPYWVIQDISQANKYILFTVLASCPDFISGPAGLVKIINGEITDSYGFFDTRKNITEKPEPELLLNWFGKNGDEEIIRENYLKTQPKLWCDENYMDNLIEFKEEELIKIESLVDQPPQKNTNEGWKEISLEELEQKS